MIVGALNFAFVYHLFTRKIRKAFSWEILTFFVIIIVGTVTFSQLGRFEIVDSFFHVVSMSSSAGFDYLHVATLNSTLLSILILLMLVGGCTFSMAGGIRISRLIASAKSVKESIKGVLIKEHAIPAEPRHSLIDPNANREYISAPVIIILFILVLAVFSIIFTTIGNITFTDALFEVGSALTTNGISMGATNVLMPIGYKWLIIAAMTIGRVEILSILIALSAYRRKTPSAASLSWLHRSKK
jgi:trk system potassium uptake protein TrkH